jgi:hypothetical protein
VNCSQLEFCLVEKWTGVVGGDQLQLQRYSGYASRCHLRLWRRNSTFFYEHPKMLRTNVVHDSGLHRNWRPFLSLGDGRIGIYLLDTPFRKVIDYVVIVVESFCRFVYLPIVLRDLDRRLLFEEGLEKILVQMNAKTLVSLVFIRINERLQELPFQNLETLAAIHVSIAAWLLYMLRVIAPITVVLVNLSPYRILVPFSITALELVPCELFRFCRIPGIVD